MVEAAVEQAVGLDDGTESVPFGLEQKWLRIM